jgi:hypothetical protein
MKSKNHLENKSNPPESSKQEEQIHNSSIESLIPISKSETNIMEVHHHPHTSHGKKNWKTYVWEFLMLFLAVFCGFLAEYQLEHKIESDRAKELAKNFYDELKNDSIIVQTKFEYRTKQENALKFLMTYFKDSSLTNVSKKFQVCFLHGISFRSPSLFEPRTVVLEQLKNSGSLRYFKNEELQKLIGDISVAIRNINDRQALESSVRIEYINPLIIRHYDFDFNSQLSQNGNVSIIDAAAAYENNNEEVPFHFKSIDKFDRQSTINALGFYCFNALNSTRTFHFMKYIDLNTELLKLLRKEYHLN